MKRSILLFLLSLMITISDSFSLFSNNYINNIKNNIKNNNIRHNELIFMDYNFLKNYDDKFNTIPSFQCRIIINNWIEYLTSKNDNLSQIDDFNKRSIHDFKLFIAINQDNKKTPIYFAWCPDNSIKKKNVIYIVGGLIHENTLEIHRIAQNPYAENMLSVNSNELYNEISNYVDNSTQIKNVSYSKLYDYDIRYKLSWTYR